MLSEIPVDPKDRYSNAVTQIYQKLDEYYNDFSANITYIYGRHDLHFALDLVYHSLLQFTFLEQPIRGWVQALVVGDTRTGKSTLVRRQMKNYGYGEILTGENVSFAGIVGGIDESNNMRYVHWGTYPQNDRGLVVIDEVQETEPQIITRLSNVRSSGIAEIKKIRSMRTHARVRSLWVGNPRFNMQLEHFDCGVEAVGNVIGKPEDIARFDFALSAGLNDVPEKFYEFKRSDMPRVEERYAQNLNRKLIRWCWSRRREHVVINEETENAIIDYATKLSDVYTQKIPLVIKAEEKDKIARLTVALAARLFSTDEACKQCIVKPEHAAAIYYYLNAAYKKESFRYYDFSKRKALEEEEIKKTLRGYGKRIISTLLQYSVINQTLINGMVADRKTGRALWSWLLTSGCLEQTPKSSLLRKTTEFASILRQLQRESNLPEAPPEPEDDFDGQF